MNQTEFLPIRAEDVDALLAMYLHYVRNTTVTFHCREITHKEMSRLLFFEDQRCASFGIWEGEEMCGYVAIHPFSDREAYKNTAEVSLYLMPEHTGKGLGGQALAFIEGFAQEGGFHVLLSLISGENEASIRLFERHGYTRYGVMREGGEKFGRMIDVVEYQKILS